MIYGYGNNTREQFVEWYNKPMDDIIGYDGKIPTSKPIICLETNEYIGNLKLYCKENNICENSVRTSCKKYSQYYGKHYLYVDEYKSMSKEDINNIILDAKNNTCFNNRIVQLDKEMNVLCIFNKANDAVNFLDKSSCSSIVGVAKHYKTHKTAYGYKWEYFDYYYKNIYNGDKTPLELLNEYLVDNS